MSKLLWNKIMLEEFLTLAALTEEEEKILRSHIKGDSRVKQAMDNGMSLSTVDRIMKRVNLKYDDVQRYASFMPPRIRQKADK